MQRHSLSAFGHVVLWVSAIILQTGKQWRGTTWCDNDANVLVLLIRPWTMWKFQSTHQHIKTCISFSFTGDKIQRNLLRQTDEPKSNTFWCFGDWLSPSSVRFPWRWGKSQSPKRRNIFKLRRGCLSEKTSPSRKTCFLRRKVTDWLRITWI